MITCKEDLAGKYALRSDTEVFKLFADKCNEFGLFYGNTYGKDAHRHPEAECVNADLSDDTLTHCPEEYYIREGYTKLTLKDFGVEPTKVEYIKCEIPKLSTAIALVEEGGVFHYKATEGLKPFWVEVKAPNYQSVVANWEHFHVKTETPLTWKDSLSEYLNADREKPCVIFSEFDMFGKKGGWGLSEEEFITMCKIVVDGVVDNKEYE